VAVSIFQQGNVFYFITAHDSLAACSIYDNNVLAG
jgi:uncharacterized protein YtpQ (UPF0354 family)